MRFVGVQVLLWLLPSSAATDLRVLDGYIQAEMALNQIPGLSLAMARDGAVVSVQAYGVKSLRTREPMAVDTPVELASLSKSFTALAVLQLEEAGRLALDLPVSHYLPDFHTGGRAAFRNIIVRNLLEHTSGLSRRHDYLVPCCGRPGEFDLNLAVRRLQEAELRGPPGAFFRYANSNYVLLAALVERVSGESFPNYMETHIFGPLGMTRTTLDQAQARAWGLADTHERQWGRVRPSSSRFSGWYGASMVKSTASDMARYVIALGPSAAEWLKTSRGKPYHMGWFIRCRAEWLNGEPVVEHTGSIWGGNTAAIIAPKSKLAVVILLNAGVSRAGEIARGVLARVAGLPGPEPGATQWTKIPDNWAICFSVAAALIMAWLTVHLSRAWAQLRRGERRFAWTENWWQVGRALLLLAMVAFLPNLLLGGAKPLVTRFPATVKVGLSLLAVATMALLLSTAVLGLAPRRKRRT